MSNQPSTAAEDDDLSDVTHNEEIKSTVVKGVSNVAGDGSVVEYTVVKENNGKFIRISTTADNNSIVSESSQTSNKTLKNKDGTSPVLSKSKKDHIVYVIKQAGQQHQQQQLQQKKTIILAPQPVPLQVQNNISAGKKMIIEPRVTGGSVQPLVSGNNRIQVANILSKNPDVNTSKNTLNINSLPLNFLPSPKTNKTIVKQPNDGPCMCFVCGQKLCDPTERICYLKKQKLCNTQLTLLELLSDSLNQIVETNTNTVDLCSTCSELLNETDNALSHVNRLKKQINSYFTNNQRPKLTYQAFPKNSNFGIVPSGNIPQPYQPPQLNLDQVFQKNNNFGIVPCGNIPQPYQPPPLNLDDLAAERLKRRNQNRKKKATTKMTNSTDEKNACTVCKQIFSNKDMVIDHMLKEHEVQSSVKKKGNKLEKPYACNVCKQKFLSKDMVIDHMLKEHEVQPYTCNICQQKYSDKKMVIDHMIKEHEVNPAGMTRFRRASKPNQTYENNEEDTTAEPIEEDTALEPIEQDTADKSIKKELDDINDEQMSKDVPKNITKMESKAKNTTNIVSKGKNFTKIKPKAKNTTNIELNSKTSSESNSLPTSKGDTSAASQLLAAMKPIQPRPSTIVQTAPDGSVFFIMNPTAVESASTVIKVSTGNMKTTEVIPDNQNINPGNQNFKPGTFPCKKCSMVFTNEKSRRMHRIYSHGFRKREHEGDELEESEDDSYVKRFGHEKLWQCNVCDSVFNSKNLLARHRIKAHSSEHLEVNQQKESLQECDQCDEAFIHKHELEKHKETH